MDVDAVALLIPTDYGSAILIKNQTGIPVHDACLHVSPLGDDGMITQSPIP
jgi:hypothetical protein